MFNSIGSSGDAFPSAERLLQQIQDRAVEYGKEKVLDSQKYDIAHWTIPSKRAYLNIPF